MNRILVCAIACLPVGAFAADFSVSKVTIESSENRLSMMDIIGQQTPVWQAFGLAADAKICKSQLCVIKTDENGRFSFSSKERVYHVATTNGQPVVVSDPENWTGVDFSGVVDEKGKSVSFKFSLHTVADREVGPAGFGAKVGQPYLSKLDVANEARILGGSFVIYVNSREKKDGSSLWTLFLANKIEAPAK